MQHDTKSHGRAPAWLDRNPESRPGENWVSVVDFEGAYMVSDQGRVISLDRVNQHSDGHSQRVSGRVLSQRLDRRCGYYRVNLYKNGDRHTRLVHRLMLVAFVGPCPEGYEALHVDGQPTSNTISNLSWEEVTAHV